jgi:hypothetical protein
LSRSAVIFAQRFKKMPEVVFERNFTVAVARNGSKPARQPFNG